MKVLISISNILLLSMTSNGVISVHSTLGEVKDLSMLPIDFFSFCDTCL